MRPWSEDLEVPPSIALRVSDESLFDGNHGDMCSAWLYPRSATLKVITLEDLEALWRTTVEGHLAWVLIPPPGFRL